MKTSKIIELIAKCPKCGNNNAVTTSDLHKACFICKLCGTSRKIRGSKGWNVVVNFRRENEKLNEAVMRLNKENDTDRSLCVFQEE